MSQLIKVRTRIEKATERQKDLDNRIKVLKKQARGLSVRVQSDANRLAGRAVCDLIAAGLPVDSTAILAKAIELARPSEADALEVLTERLVERTDESATDAPEVETDTAATPDISRRQPTTTASPASRPFASASFGAAGGAIATAPTGATPAKESETVGPAHISPNDPSKSTGPGPTGYAKPLRRLI